MDKAAQDFLKALEERSELSKRLERKTINRIYNSLTTRRPIRVQSDLPLKAKIEALSKLQRRESRKKWRIAFILLATVFLIVALSGCSSSIKVADAQRSAPSSKVEITKIESTKVENLPTSVDQASSKSVTESTDSRSTSKKVSKTPKKSKKALTKKVIEKTPSGNSQEAKAPTSTEVIPSEDQLRASNPPAIGAVVPWYNPTAESVAKAYTSAKPIAFGNNYALIVDGDTRFLIFLASVKDGIGYWRAYIRTNISQEGLSMPLKFEQNVSEGPGTNEGILWTYDNESGAWLYIQTVNLARPEDSRYGIKLQSWMPPKIIRASS